MYIHFVISMLMSMSSVCWGMVVITNKTSKGAHLRAVYNGKEAILETCTSLMPNGDSILLMNYMCIFSDEMNKLSRVIISIDEEELTLDAEGIMEGVSGEQYRICSHTDRASDEVYADICSRSKKLQLSKEGVHEVAGSKESERPKSPENDDLEGFSKIL